MPNTKEGTSKDELENMLKGSFRPKDYMEGSFDVQEILETFDSWALTESSFSDPGKDWSRLLVFKHNGSDVPQLWEVIYERYVAGF